MSTAWAKLPFFARGFGIVAGLQCGGERLSDMPAYRDTRLGRWRYRTRATTPDGRRVRIGGTPTTNTKKAAEAAERAHILRVETPSVAAAATPTPTKEVATVKQFSEVFLDGHSAADKPSAFASKKRILNTNILPKFGATRLDGIQQMDVDVFRAHLLSGGRSRKTCNNILAVLSSLLRYAAKNKIIPHVEMEFFIREDESEMVDVAAADVEALLGVTEDARYRVAVLLANDAGLRVGEIRALTWGDINELGREVTVSKSYDPRNNLTSAKNRQRRTVPMSDRLWDEIQGLERLGGTLVCRLDGKPLGYFGMRDKIHALYKAAGVTAPPKPWHCLRHGFCSRLAEKGVPINIIRDMAGHNAIETTLKYIHSNKEQKSDAIRRTFGQHLANTASSETRKARKT